MCSKDQISETRESFQVPKLKKPTPTRSGHLRKFLWKELYDEYIRSYDRMLTANVEPTNTEYFDQFSKDMQPEDEEAREARMIRYPLYATRPITLWNPHGDIDKDFKKRYTITRPVHEQTEQFG